MISFELSEEQQIVRSTMAEFGKSPWWRLAGAAARYGTSRIDDGVLAC